jgi:Cu-processing system permease protein
MFTLATTTFRGIVRDKVFRGILMIAVVFLFIPSVSGLSMRQVTELSITLSLSLISVILLLLAVFLGGTSLWKDMERRYTFSVLGMPITRTDYLLGKFIGISSFILLTVIVLGIIGSLVIWQSSGAYPPERPIVWTNLFLAMFFDMLKYILLVAWAFLFSTVSTSFFLPIFGSISIFFIGSATQEVYEYINSAACKSYPVFFKMIVKLLYYVLPNFSAFDLKVNAIYGVPPSHSGLALTVAYFVVYTSILLALSSKVYGSRELQ